MATRGDFRLRPLAIVCALVMLVWGLFCAASLVAQIQLNNGSWGLLKGWVGWSQWTSIAASIVGLLAIVWAALGLRWRGALHLGVVTVLVTLALIVAGHVIQNDHMSLTLSDFVRGYWRGMTWRTELVSGSHHWWYFVDDWRVPLGVVVLVLWLLVAVTGAGKRRPGAAAGTGTAFGAAGYAAPTYTGPGFERSGSDERPEAEGQQAFLEPVPTLGGDAGEPGQPDQPDQPDVEGAPAPASTSEPATKPEPEPDPEPASAPVPVPSARGAVWFVTVQGTDHGPYPLQKLRGFLDEGRLHSATITHLADGENRRLADVLDANGA